MNRTFKGSAMFGTPPRAELRSNSKSVWLCLYDGDRYLGNIEGVANLRRLAESILEALPPKRGQS